MKVLRISLVLVVALCMFLAVRLPITTTPGFFIGGDPEISPETWIETSSIHEIKLRVSGMIPRVVIIWFVEIENDLYVVGETESGWVNMLGDGGRVHVRLGDKTHPLQASIIDSGIANIIQAWEEKYLNDYPEFFNTSASEDFLESVSVYKLSRI